MKKTLLWGFLWVLGALPAFANENCEDLITYQVCWPGDQFVIFSGIHNGFATFTVDVEGFNGSVDLSDVYASAEDLHTVYMSHAVFYEGTYEKIDSNVENSVLTFTFSGVGVSQINAPRNANLGIAKIVSILLVDDRLILAETFFPNPFQLQKNAVWNEQRLEVHEKFTSYIRGLDN